ncbi:MAG: DUF1273 family protein [Clostridia bacterium]|nr:DUF1273 family protein [Clostridia bacterium]
MEQLVFLKTEEKACALTGHRDLSGLDKALLKDELERLIKDGVEVFYNGLALGFDLLAAEILLKLKKTYSHVKLIGCAPFPKQAKAYPAEEKKRYEKIVKCLDELVYVCDHYTKFCYFSRNDYMCERADVLLAFLRKQTGGTAYTVKRFQKKGRVIFI